jgi:hypothetical protein
VFGEGLAGHALEHRRLPYPYSSESLLAGLVMSGQESITTSCQPVEASRPGWERPFFVMFGGCELVRLGRFAR